MYISIALMPSFEKEPIRAIIVNMLGEVGCIML